MKTVLIVEDNEINMLLENDIVANLGYKTICVTTGEEALAIAPEAKPHLILMDIQLSGVNGLSTTIRLKSNPQTADIPIIAVSAYAFERDIHQALRAGCDDYLVKPLDYEIFVKTIKKYLD